MTRLMLFVVVVGLGLAQFSSGLFAQQARPITEFKVGVLNPADTDNGNTIGFSTGARLDDRLYWAIELNHFKSTYRKTTTVAEFDSGGIRFREKQLELDFSTRIVMIFFQIYYELKLGPDSPFYFRSAASGGLELIWNNEKNFVEDVERTRFFNGFGWQVAGGLGVKVSRSGMVFFDMVYNNAKASKAQERNEEGLPVFREIDLSGIGFRAGINLFGLGFFGR